MRIGVARYVNPLLQRDNHSAQQSLDLPPLTTLLAAVQGYYFVPSEEITQKEIAIAAGKILHRKGAVATDQPKQVSLGELDAMLSHIPFPGVARLLFAANSRSSPDRVRKVLLPSFRPRGPGFFDSLEDDLERAARS